MVTHFSKVIKRDAGADMADENCSTMKGETCARQEGKNTKAKGRKADRVYYQLHIKSFLQ